MEKIEIAIMLALSFLLILLFPHFVVFTVNFLFKGLILLAAVVFALYLYNKYK